MANRMSEPCSNRNLLGSYLKDRRNRLDPAALGLSGTRRRTPGLRREEVAQRANISPTWYTWLEQGRGGAPSADVLDRIARALMLTDVEREHLYLLGLGRPPEVSLPSELTALRHGCSAFSMHWRSAPPAGEDGHMGCRRLEPMLHPSG